MRSAETSVSRPVEQFYDSRAVGLEKLCNHLGPLLVFSCCSRRAWQQRRRGERDPKRVLVATTEDR